MGVGSVFCKKNYPVEGRNDTWKLYANVAMHRDILNLRMKCMNHSTSRGYIMLLCTITKGYTFSDYFTL